MSDICSVLKLEKILKDGLGESWRISGCELSGEPSYEFHVFTRLRLKDVYKFDTADALSELFNQLDSKLKTTVAFQSIKHKHEYEIENVTNELEELKSEVKRLQEFEIYFNKEKEMKHGYMKCNEETDD